MHYRRAQTTSRGKARIKLGAPPRGALADDGELSRKHYCGASWSACTDLSNHRLFDVDAIRFVEWDCSVYLGLESDEKIVFIANNKRSFMLSGKKPRSLLYALFENVLARVYILKVIKLSLKQLVLEQIKP